MLFPFEIKVIGGKGIYLVLENSKLIVFWKLFFIDMEMIDKIKFLFINLKA